MTTPSQQTGWDVVPRFLCTFGRHGWDYYVTRPYSGLLGQERRAVRICRHCEQVHLWYEMLAIWGEIEKVPSEYLPLELT